MAPIGEVEQEGLPGSVSAGQLSDANQRLFYKRWAQMMDAETWADMPVEVPVAEPEAAE